MGWWKSFSRNVGKFGQLSLAHQFVLVQAIVLLPLIALGLRLWGFQAICRLLERSLPQTAFQPADRQGRNWQGCSGTITRLVQAAAKHGIWRANCLQRSLLLWWLLRRRGIAAELRIGVSRRTQRLEAHAWVEYEGIVLGDRPDIQQTFTPFTNPIR